MDKRNEMPGEGRQDANGRVVNLLAYRAKTSRAAPDTTGHDRLPLAAPKPLSLRSIGHRQRMLRHLAAQARSSATR